MSATVASVRRPDAPVLVTRDGVVLAARWWLPSGGDRATVVLAHGFSASKDDGQLVAVAEVLRRAGYAVLSYDARGHAGSGGLCTMGDLERLDVAAAVAEARTRSAPVVAVGASMGAIAVLRYAATDPDLAGVVSVSSPALWRLPSNVRTLGAAMLTRTRAGRRLAERWMHVRVSPRWDDPEPPKRLAARLSVPLAVVHGGRDRFIEPSEAPLLAAAAPRARLLLVPAMRHAFDRAAVPAVREAVDWVLEASAHPSGT
ncbi:MAG: alpha/beta hydrolase [Candidatus Velamenicoccus archaeovorus]